jgi:hypothetical protein
MSTLEQIEQQVRQLTRAEQEALRDWLEKVLEDELEMTNEFKAKIERGEEDLRSSKTRQRIGERIRMRDGDAILVMVKGDEVIHHSWNMSLPHVEFVKRTTGHLPEGAWVGTVSKLDGEVAAITSKYFFGYQLPAPEEVITAVRRTFE